MPWRELNAGAISGYEVQSTVNSNGVRELQLTSRESTEGWYKLNAEAVSGFNIEINGQDSKGTINFKTDGTLTGRYYPPDNDNVDFQLQSYTAPSNDAADLSLADFGKILIDQSIVTEVTIDGRVTEDLTVEGDTVSSIVDTLPAYNSVEDLVAWYRFEDGDARDYATFEYAADPTANDGTVSGATYQQFSGVRDFDKGCNSGAYSFGGNDYITTGVNRDKNSFSYVAWVKAESIEASGNDVIISTFESSDSEWTKLAVGVGGFLFVVTTNSKRKTIASVPDVNTGEWYHAVATRDGSTGDMKLYINGSQAASGTNDSGTIPAINNDRIAGRATDGTLLNFNGIIDDVRIYDTVLTSEQVNQIYQATIP